MLQHYKQPFVWTLCAIITCLQLFLSWSFESLSHKAEHISSMAIRSSLCHLISAPAVCYICIIFPHLANTFEDLYLITYFLILLMLLCCAFPTHLPGEQLALTSVLLDRAAPLYSHICLLCRIRHLKCIKTHQRPRHVCPS